MASVSAFFNLAAQSPFSQLQISWRERSLELGEALVQSGMELQIRLRLQAGLIRLVSHRQVQADLEDHRPQEEEVGAAPGHPGGVRLLRISPLPTNASCAEVRAALEAAGLRVTAVRTLTPRACEVAVDADPQVDHLIANGLALRANWHVRASDVMRRRHAQRSAPRQFCCFLCHQRGHVESMCIRQRPRLLCMLGA